MSLGEALLVVAQFGAEWVLWLLVALSTVSLAIVCERLWFFARRRIDVELLAGQLVQILKAGNPPKARAALAAHRAPECAVLAAGLASLEFGSAAAAEAMQSSRLREQTRMQCNLGLLSAIASAAPLLGLLGTVLGAVELFDTLAALPADQNDVFSLLMAGLARALVTTGLGFFVAVPAAAALRLFEPRVQASLAQVDSLTHLVLSQAAALAAREAAAAAAPTTKAA